MHSLELQRSNVWAALEKFHCLELHLDQNMNYKNSLRCGEIDSEYDHRALSALTFCLSDSDLPLCRVSLTELEDSLLASLE